MYLGILYCSEHNPNCGFFLIRHARNESGGLVQLKLDELTRANKEARNTLLDLQMLNEEENNRIKAQPEGLALQPMEAAGPTALC